MEQLVQEVEARQQARQAAAAGGGDLAQMLQVKICTVGHNLSQCCGSGSKRIGLLDPYPLFWYYGSGSLLFIKNFVAAYIR